MKTFRFAGEISKPKDGLYWVQALRVGGWNYPDGEDEENGFDLTEDVLREMKRRFDAGEKSGGERDVPLNLKHDEDLECGWVKALELRDNDRQLWAGFEITDPDVKKKVDQKTLKYSSSEIDLAWVNPEACRLDGDCDPRKVFEGLALTNHPYIKGMDEVELPVNLSDFPKDLKALEDDSAGTRRRKCSCNKERTTKGGYMPELEDLQAGMKALEKKLEEFSTAQAGAKAELSDAQKESEKALKAQLAEMNNSILTTQRGLQLKELETSIRSLAVRRKITVPFSNRLRRLGTFLIMSGNTVALCERIKLADGKEELRPVKIKLADGKDESLDKLDVIGEVVDMLGQLPDAIASRPEDLANLSEDCDPNADGKTDDEKIVEKAKAMAEKDPTGFGKKPIQRRLAEAADALGLNDWRRRTKGRAEGEGGQQ